jgi:hypothetical protein
VLEQHGAIALQHNMNFCIFSLPYPFFCYKKQHFILKSSIKTNFPSNKFITKMKSFLSKCSAEFERKTSGNVLEQHGAIAL